jgi:hypothetical protein
MLKKKGRLNAVTQQFESYSSANVARFQVTVPPLARLPVITSKGLTSHSFLALLIVLSSSALRNFGTKPAAHRYRNIGADFRSILIQYPTGPP